GVVGGHVILSVSTGDDCTYGRERRQVLAVTGTNQEAATYDQRRGDRAERDPHRLVDPAAVRGEHEEEPDPERSHRPSRDREAAWSDEVPVSRELAEGPLPLPGRRERRCRLRSVAHPWRLVRRRNFGTSRLRGRRRWPEGGRLDCSRNHRLRLDRCRNSRLRLSGHGGCERADLDELPPQPRELTLEG